MRAWVIKSNSGLYYYECLDSYYSGFGHLHGNISLYDSESNANKTIELYELKNCKPIPFIITECEFESENKQLEKALELACKHIENFSDGCYYCPKKQYENNSDCELESGETECIKWLKNYFKAKAKEEEKDE